MVGWKQTLASSKRGSRQWWASCLPFWQHSFRLMIGPRRLFLPVDSFMATSTLAWGSEFLEFRVESFSAAEDMEAVLVTLHSGELHECENAWCNLDGVGNLFADHASALLAPPSFGVMLGQPSPSGKDYFIAWIESRIQLEDAHDLEVSEAKVVALRNVLKSSYNSSSWF